MERMIEVCAGSYQDCIAAYQGKAKQEGTKDYKKYYKSLQSKL